MTRQATRPASEDTVSMIDKVDTKKENIYTWNQSAYVFPTSYCDLSSAADFYSVVQTDCCWSWPGLGVHGAGGGWGWGAGDTTAAEQGLPGGAREHMRTIRRIN